MPKHNMTLHFERVIAVDPDPDLSWLDQTDAQMGEGFEAHARERKAAFERGDWHMIGVQARVTVAGQTFESAGLWNIESDSDESYLNDVFEQEKAELLAMLEDLRAALAMKLPALTHSDRHDRDV